MNLPNGTILQGGKYRILNAAEILPKHENVELGQGSFGITYLAEHTALGKRVCIKEFFMKELNLRSEDGSITGLSDGTLSYNYAQKFRKEAMNLAGMEHPNIVRVTDSFDENGTFYYVMDYIEGQNLNEYIKDHVLSESEAISIIKDVANALMYMHEQKQMLHLDLKPGNIMRRASDGHIFLIDFGLSKHYDKNGTPETSTTIGGGTPGYAPIEQGDKAKDGEFRPTIDVYALGATLFKLLTRETPPTASEVVNDDEILAEKLSNNGVSQGIIDLVVKAMMPGSKKRIQTVRLFVEMLGICNNLSNVSSLNVDDDENTIVTDNSSEEESIEDTMYSSSNKNSAPPPPQKTRSENYTFTDLGTTFLNKDSNENSRNQHRFTSKKSVIRWIMAIIIVIVGVFFFQKNKNVNSFENGELRINGISYKMIKVDAGSFTMGATPQMEYPAENEHPAHDVRVNHSFYIGQTEVTQALWIAVMGSNPSKHVGVDKPVDNVSWNDCQEFINKLNSLVGEKFRFPDEVEWEFAARGGNHSKSYQYSGSDISEEVAWHIDNSGGESQIVGKKTPNELGIYDMSGNVAEWCAATKNRGLAPFRGGSCENGVWFGRASTRNWTSVNAKFQQGPSGMRYSIGLRLALSDQ